jgi:SAM-dependent methyltransferase
LFLSRLEKQLKSVIRWSPLHPQYLARRRIKRAVTSASPSISGTVVDVGAGSQPYRTILESQSTQYVAGDVTYADGIDLLLDAQSLPIGDGKADSVVMIEVLEHTPNPFVTLQEAARVLRNGGTLVLTTPMTWGLHGEPYDFFRFTKHGLRRCIESAEFVDVTITPFGGLFEVLGARFIDGVTEAIFPARSVPIQRWGWRLSLVPFAAVATLVVNVFSVVFDTIFTIRTDTIGHVAVARMKHSSD